jgi:hypothetical protein
MTEIDVNPSRSKPKAKVFLSRSGGSGPVYWTLRSTDRGEMRYGRVVRRAHRVVHNFGRFPIDPQAQHSFLAKVRIMLRAYGIATDIKPVKRQQR